MADAPLRIQRRRTKGWRMPDGAVYVGRPTRWGNPFPWKSMENLFTTEREMRAEVVDMYRECRCDKPGWVDEVKRELRGHDLACWCPTCPEHRDGLPPGVRCEACAPCHADVLLTISNDRN